MNRHILQRQLLDGIQHLPGDSYRIRQQRIGPQPEVYSADVSLGPIDRYHPVLALVAVAPAEYSYRATFIAPNRDYSRVTTDLVGDGGHYRSVISRNRRSRHGMPAQGVEHNPGDGDRGDGGIGAVIVTGGYQDNRRNQNQQQSDIRAHTHKSASHS